MILEGTELTAMLTMLNLTLNGKIIHGKIIPAIYEKIIHGKIIPKLQLTDCKSASTAIHLEKSNQSMRKMETSYQASLLWKFNSPPTARETRLVTPKSGKLLPTQAIDEYQSSQPITRDL